MGSIAVVTSFSPKGYLVYGRRMLQGFDKYWPKDIPIYVFHEGEKPRDADWRGKWVSLDTDKDRAAFMAANGDHPSDYGRQPVKFSHKVFAITAAPRDIDWLIWLDADIETRAPVTHKFLESVLPEEVTASYLGRGWWRHSETGFVAYRLNDDGSGEQFLDAMRKAYVDGHVLKLLQQHDAAVFDAVRCGFGQQGYKFNDLGKDHYGPGLDVMAKSPLGAVMWHAKGNARKMSTFGTVA